MPKVYIRQVVHPKTRLSAYEVVDGQQRLRAILDFHKGALELSKLHNSDVGDTSFEGLSDALQRVFLNYEISTEVMKGASDPEVWAMFERLNTYTVTLNKQERLNAKWFGYFKQTAYKLASEQASLNAWRELRVFSDRQITRMREVELTSDILLAMVKGISDITEIGKAYKEYDVEFSNRGEVAKRFREGLAYITEQLADPIKTTKFKNKSWFYSLFVATLDAKRGIPNGFGRGRIQDRAEVHERMSNLNSLLGLPEPPVALTLLKNALSRATSHVPERLVRHEWFYKLLTAKGADWNRLLR